MILPDWMIREYRIFSPFSERTVHRGMSHGLSSAGYDVRIDILPEHNPMGEDGEFVLTLAPGAFALASTVEEFTMPHDVLGIVHDKSTWARQGIALQNTVIEPGWKGYLTLELTNHSRNTIKIHRGDPIAQIVLHLLAAKPSSTYTGKYQNQERGPQAARFEET
jgi:dCTP deaminase